jgi:T5orf172 domain
MTLDRETLLQMLAEDEYGLLKPVPKRAPVTADDRLLAAFQEIAEFTRSNGREPERTPADMTEARLAMRLKAIRENEDQAAALRGADDLGLLGEAPPQPEPVRVPDTPPETVDDARAADPFGLLDGAEQIFDLKHVPKTQTMPEEIARRRPAEDFDRYEQLFKNCHAGLRAGQRKLLPFRNPIEIEEGKFFVLNGVLLYVAEMGERELDQIRKANARTRCIFENGTESNLLMQSLASNLYKDGRRVTEPSEVTLERMGLEAETKMGHVYVLRSLSDDPQLAGFESVHKIGFTKQTVEHRIAGAEGESTFLGAPVEIVASYSLPAVAAQPVEAILHSFFASARLDTWFEQSHQIVAEANEWFDVPLSAIDEAIALIQSEGIQSYEYDPDVRRIKLRS